MVVNDADPAVAVGCSLIDRRAEFDLIFLALGPIERRALAATRSRQRRIEIDGAQGDQPSLCAIDIIATAVIVSATADILVTITLLFGDRHACRAGKGCGEIGAAFSPAETKSKGPAASVAPVTASAGARERSAWPSVAERSATSRRRAREAGFGPLPRDNQDETAALSLWSSNA